MQGIAKTLQLKWQDHLENWSQLFTSMYASSALTDVTICCSGGSLKAHKLVLSACSPFFEQIFRDNPCQHPIVILKGIPFTEINLLVEFMYKGTIDVQELDLQSLMHTASELEIKGLSYDAQDDSTEPTDHPVHQLSSPVIQSGKNIKKKKKATLSSKNHHYQDDRRTQSEVNSILSAAAKEMEAARSTGELLVFRAQTEFKSTNYTENEISPEKVLGIKEEPMIESQAENFEELEDLNDNLSTLNQERFRRGRGRPRKSVLPPQTTLTNTIKRKRGRPRKYSLSGATPYPQPLVKRKRGRPRKTDFIISDDNPEDNYNASNLPYGDFSHLTAGVYNTDIGYNYEVSISDQNSHLDTFHRSKDVSESSGDDERIDQSVPLMTVGDCRIFKIPLGKDKQQNNVASSNSNSKQLFTHGADVRLLPATIDNDIGTVSAVSDPLQ